ncbi:MAG: PfkB family carbohydrate kinase, partial [Mesorhizobium sp.]|nr:PfkB family carbohydrate kinase [Mesorhizobium sp.]
TELKGADRQERMRSFVTATGNSVIVTLGSDGVHAASPFGFLIVTALDIEPVDTVGAGDTFCGYLAASLEKGMSLAEALHRAAVAGSLACLKPGAQPAIPTAAEVAAKL